MRHTVRLIIANLKRMLSGYEFWVCVLLLVILFFTSPLYTDYEARRDVSVFEAIRKIPCEEMRANTQFCIHHVLQICVSGWVKMFLPMIAAFPFVSLHCTAHAAGGARFFCVRMPKRCYEAGTFLSAMLCGGLMLLAALILFAVSICFFFPHIAEYDTSLREMYARGFAEMYPFYSALGYPYLYALRGAEMFLYGAVSSVPACFLACLMQNKYLNLSIPFFLKYMLLQFEYKLLASAYADAEAFNTRQIKFAALIDPDRVSRLLTDRAGALQNSIFYAVLLIAAFAVYKIIMHRRWDYGA